MFSLTLTSTIVYLLCFISIIFLQVHGQLDEGSECSINGKKGICKLISDCIPVYKSLQAGNPPEKNCGYKGRIPVVCCPNDESPTTDVKMIIEKPNPTYDGRGTIAREKCKEYSQYVYQLIYPPIFIIGQKPINVSTCGIKGKTLIVGGEKAAAREFPHMVALGYESSNGIEWKCGGSLVSKRFVLTAAHCLRSGDGVAPTVVRVGDLNLVSTNDIANPKDYKIIEKIRNPQYKPPLLYHDIALLKLETDVEFNEFARPACLQTALPDSPENKATATGWGIVKFDTGKKSDDLLKVTINVVNHTSCNKFSYSNIQYNRGIVNEWQICAGEFGKDTCGGDSGGPLLIFNDENYCMYNIIGVTSAGQICGLYSPGLYTKVYNYVPWLESVIWAEHD
ncbi:PREDICTED: venom protease-like [Polistes canadensis]|uniref:venom protease-like n=1 Tax=Polistes canadensis TaxID=91411 RepID=UPI000718CC61|nr:PREDICTED: venom protease-like [Polistes canadensis]